MNKGYFVSGDGDGELGFAVVAESEVEAIAIAWDAELRDTCDEWRRKDVECIPLPKANIEGLSLGMVQDERDALRRGLYDFLQGQECDECGEHDDLECHEGRALCHDCIWDAMNGDDEE
jgi:hypothetical protein